jgi:hypothetical protein
MPDLSQGGWFHHAPSCHCSMCRDSKGKQHPVLVSPIITVAKPIITVAKPTCAKCGRVFTSPNQYRFNSKGEPICRKFCRERAQ